MSSLMNKVQEQVGGQLNNLGNVLSQLKSFQDKALNEVQSKLASQESLMNNFSTIANNAKNIISQDAAQFANSKLQDTIQSIIQKADVGLSSIYPDLSKKQESMLGNLSGDTSSAVEDPISFITNTSDNSISGIDFGSPSTSMLSGLGGGTLDKLTSRIGSSITSDFSLTNSISSLTSTIQDGIAGAKSIMPIVNMLQSNPIAAAVTLVSGTAASDMLPNFISDTIYDIKSIFSDFGLDELIYDLADLFKAGDDVYGLLTDQNCQNIPGMNGMNYNQLMNMLNAAKMICSNFNNSKYNDLINFDKNKNIYDMLLLNMMKQGMYGGLEDLVNCSNCDNYFDDRSVSLMSNSLPFLANNGDLNTFMTVQQIIGNSNISNVDYLLYQLAINGNYNTQQSRNNYTDLMYNMNSSPPRITQYDTSPYYGYNDYSNNVYNARNVRNINNNSAELLSMLTGNRTTGYIADALLTRFLN